MPITVDLHMHTTASDGRLTPTELVQLAASKGLRTISVPTMTPPPAWSKRSVPLTPFRVCG